MSPEIYSKIISMIIISPLVKRRIIFRLKAKIKFFFFFFLSLFFYNFFFFFFFLENRILKMIDLKIITISLMKIFSLSQNKTIPAMTKNNPPNIKN